MGAKDTERIEAMKNCLAKWFDKGRDWGNAPVTKEMLAELEAEGEDQAEITWKARELEIEEARRAGVMESYPDGFLDGGKAGKEAGIREVVEWINGNTEPSFAGERATLQFFKRFDDRKWQAFLKEKEIK